MSDEIVDAGAHPFVRQVLRGSHLVVNTRVALADEMLTSVLAKHDWDFAITAYFDRGLQAFRSHLTILRAVRPGFDGDILDFAAGYGRVTRFLAAHHGHRRVTAADIQAPALAFQLRELGVEIIESRREPDAIVGARRFDMINAHSFFSHLPAGAFGNWLRGLREALRPGGLLVFSVHDDSLIAAADRDPSGCTFRPVSETARLDPADYGSTWVSESFVREAVARECPGHSVVRWPRGLANYQDLYIVADSPIELVQPLDQGPFGFFSICRMRGADADLIGWAAHWDPAREVDRVVVSINNKVMREITTFFRRPDVVAHTGQQHHLVSGWRAVFRWPGTASRATDVLRITAVSDTGAGTTLFTGTLASALLASARAELVAAGREGVIFPSPDAPDTLFPPE